MNHTEAQYHTGEQAAKLAEQMTEWLGRPGPNPVTPGAPHIIPPAAMMGWASPELVRWCQAARDLLLTVAEQAPRSYSPGEAAPFSRADHDAAALAEGVTPDTSDHYPAAL
jgi:hypothetical protein